MRKWVIVLAVLAGLAAAVAVLSLRLRGSASAVRLADHEKNLGHTDPRVRLEAADGILRLAPSRQDVALDKAKAQIELEQYALVRGTLDPIIQDADSPYLRTALELLAESYLSEAFRSAEFTPLDKADAATARVEALAAQAAGVRKLLAGVPGSGASALALEGREIDARAAAYVRRLERAADALARARSIDLIEQADEAGVEVGNMTDQLRQLDIQLQLICGKARKIDPEDPRPLELLLRMHLRNNNPASARAAAQELAALPKLERELAGRVADVLLNLEGFYALPTVAADVRIAGELLDHPGLTGHETLTWMLARAQLARAQGRYDDAMRHADDVLKQFPGHPRATAVMGRAMIGQGKADEAVVMLQAFNTRVRSVDARYALAMALLAKGQDTSAREVFRQCLELDPSYLPAMVGRARSQMDAGDMDEAGPDVMAAASRNPRHPGVRTLQARLLAHKQDTPGIIQFLTGDTAAVTFDDVVLVGAMVLDDAGRVRELLERAGESEVQGDRASGVAMLARAWLAASPRPRADLAATVAWAVREVVDTDPMQRVREPLTARWRMPQGAGLAPQAAADAIAPLDDWHYIESPYAVAEDLASLSARRPDAPVELRLIAGELSVWTGRLDRAGKVLDGLEDPTGLAAALRQHLAQPGSADVTALDPIHPTVQWLNLHGAIARGDPRAADSALAGLLALHPWAEPAAWLALRDAHARNDEDHGRAILATIERINEDMGLLAQARWLMARGRGQDAISVLDPLVQRNDSASVIRWRAADVLGMCYVLASQGELAAGIFESLSIATLHLKHPMQCAAVEVLWTMNRNTSAAIAVSTYAAETGLPPRWLDQYLARARVMMTPPKFAELLTRLGEPQTTDPALMLYRVRNLTDLGDLPAARIRLDQAMLLRPDSPRLLAESKALAGRSADHAVANPENAGG